MNRRQDLFKLAVVGLAALGLSFAPAAAAPIDDDERHEIHIEHKVECDGDDCPETPDGRTMVFMDKEGNKTVIEGDHHWIGADRDKMIVHGLGHTGAFLGVQLTELTPELRAHFGVPDSAGVMVSKVVDESPAQQAGIEVGDIITLVDSKEVASAGALSRAISGREEGDLVTLEIWRNGSAQRLSATLEEREGLRMAVRPRIHLRHGGDGERIERRIKIRCDSDDEECGFNAGDYDCGGAEECRVEVECADGGCSCTVNGESADCAEIPGVPHP